MDRHHYASDSFAAPVTNPVTVQTVLMLWCMNPRWTSSIIDVEGAFLQGHFENGKELYMEVPDGFERYYSGDVVLQLNIPIYVTKQGVYCFFKMFKKHVRNMTYEQSQADPCLYFAWRDNALVILVAWVDNIMILGHPDMVEQAQQDLRRAFTCKYEGKLTEYVASKLDLYRDNLGLGRVKFTQPVLVQKLEEEYTPPDGIALKAPAVEGQVLVKGDGDGMVHESMAKMYQSATATCIYVM